METPASLVSVVMAVHNGERHLAKALFSVLAQTYSTLEVIVINDGSTDSTPRLLADCHDPRLVVLKNDRNEGLARSLNRGIERAKGSYIARMDADDVCHLHRIEYQVRYMEQHPEVGLLGTACRIIDGTGNAHDVVVHPQSDAAMRWRLLFAPPLAHPTALIRREILLNHNLRYDPAWPVAQDYELWSRLLKFCRGANLTEALLDYRVHSSGTSAMKRDDQESWALRVCERESAPFLPSDLQPSLLAPLRRMLLGAPVEGDPRASYLRCQLLRLAKNYVHHQPLDRSARKEVRREVIANALADGSFIRPLDGDSFSLLRRAFLFEPIAATSAIGRLAWHFCARQLKPIGAAL